MKLKTFYAMKDRPFKFNDKNEYILGCKCGHKNNNLPKSKIKFDKCYCHNKNCPCVINNKKCSNACRCYSFACRNKDEKTEKEYKVGSRRLKDIAKKMVEDMEKHQDIGEYLSMALGEFGPTDG